jgi:hypothetical protein
VGSCPAFPGQALFLQPTTIEFKEADMSDNPNYAQTPAQIPAPTLVPTRTSTLAIISLISGILCWFLLPLIGALVAVITGHMAKSEISQSNGMVTGEGMATAGQVLGYIHLGLIVVGICIACLVLVLGLGIFGSVIRINSLVLPLVF